MNQDEMAPQEMMPEQAPQEMMPEQGMAVPEEGMEDPALQDQYETILAGLLEFIYGKGQKNIEKQLSSAKKLGETIGHITFSLLKEAASQAQQAQQELDMEVMFGVATEIIDSLIRLAHKLGKKEDPNALREEGLMTALHAYILTLNADPEQQEIAKEMLAQFTQDGTAQQAAQTIQSITERAGSPKQKPMAQGVSQGLMGA